MSENELRDLLTKARASMESTRSMYVVANFSLLIIIIIAVTGLLVIRNHDINAIIRAIESSRCTCPHRAAVPVNTNTVTINEDAIRERVIRDILKKQGEIE